MMNATRRIVFFLVLVGFAGFAFSSHACEFCNGEREKPLVTQFEDAELVLVGHFENARQSADGISPGNTDFVIERVYKDHAMLKGMTKLTLPRYIPNSKTKFIVFGEIYKGKIDAYKGTPLVNDSEMLRYIDGMVKVKAKTCAERLRYAFDFLNSPESDVSMDAYREFARSDYADYKEMAKKLPAEKLAAWLKDPKTPSYRYSLYASLLGHCGTAEHGVQLRKMMDEMFADKTKGSGMHGLLAGYIMIEPEKGWTYVKDLVKDEDKYFLARFTGLQTMRFMYESRPDLRNKDADVARREIVNGVLGAMTSKELADFAIEDLRKWKRWECSGAVLGLFGQKDFNTTTIRKAILRYALQCPNADAKNFCEEQRARDPEWFDDTKELLELEAR
jgi:hypothetical protein